MEALIFLHSFKELVFDEAQVFVVIIFAVVVVVVAVFDTVVVDVEVIAAFIHNLAEVFQQFLASPILLEAAYLI